MGPSSVHLIRGTWRSSLPHGAFSEGGGYGRLVSEFSALLGSCYTVASRVPCLRRKVFDETFFFVCTLGDPQMLDFQDPVLGSGRQKSPGNSLLSSSSVPRSLAGLLSSLCLSKPHVCLVYNSQSFSCADVEA